MFLLVVVNIQYAVGFGLVLFSSCVIPYIYSKINLLSLAWVCPSQATTWQVTLLSDFFLYTILIMISTAKSRI